MTLLALAASSRDGSLNAALMEVILAELGEVFPRPDRVDYTIFEETPQYSARLEQHSGVPETMQQLARRVAEARALLLVTPEYNHGIPGSFKNGIDWLSRVSVALLARKPVLIAGASAAPVGAWRGMRALRPSVELLGGLTVPYMISIGGVTSRAAIETRFADPAARPRIEAALSTFRHLCTLPVEPG